MDRLREKVARECLPSWALNPIAEDWEAALAKADRILALPELKEALEMRRQFNLHARRPSDVWQPVIPE